MATVTFTIRGDQVGRYQTVSGQGNNEDRVVTVTGVEAEGTASQTFTVTVEQVGAGVTQFQNGQFITIRDESGNIVVPRTVVQPDIEQRFGAGDEHLILQQSPFLIDLAGLPIGPEVVTYGFDDEVADPNRGDNDGELDFADFVCFAPGTMITTPGGTRDVADITAGDLVMTRDHGAVPVLWVGRRQVDLTHDKAQKPVVVRQGSLGPDRPCCDTVLSPDHRVLLQDPECALFFGAEEVLAPVKGLVGLRRIREMRGKRQVEYVTLLTAQHEVIFANGMAAETLYPGPEALQRIGLFGRAQILAILPRLAGGELHDSYPPARTFLTVQETRAMAEVLRLRQRFARPGAPAEVNSTGRPVEALRA
ncbi:MAG: Hint domain-containing protein [Pseudomonadota bacterium]